MCRDMLSALFRRSCMVKLHFHAQAKTLRHMACEKFKQKFKNVQYLTRPNIAASPISFDSLANKVASICRVIRTSSNPLQQLDLAHASCQDISPKNPRCNNTVNFFSWLQTNCISVTLLLCPPPPNFTCPWSFNQHGYTRGWDTQAGSMFSSCPWYVFFKDTYHIVSCVAGTIFFNPHFAEFCFHFGISSF